MSVTDEQLVEGAVGLREQEVVRGPRGVDEIISGGRRRVRRRRAAAAVPALGLTLVGGGLALALLGPGGDPVQPAPPASTSSPTSSAPTSGRPSPTTSASTPFAGWKGCTAQPATCEAAPVATWFADHVEALSPSGREAFADAATASTLDGFPDGTVYFTTGDMTDSTDVSQPPDLIVFPPQVEIYIAAKGSDSRFWIAEPVTSADKAKERRVEVRPGLDARVFQGEGSAAWRVLEGPGHGAVYLLVQDQSGRGGQSLTDGDVVDLLRLLLEDPEVTGS